MDSSRKQSPGARDGDAASILRRDVQVHDKGQLVERLLGYPIRLMADGRTGVAYKGWVYPLRRGNVIDLEEPSHEDASLRRRHGARMPGNDCDSMSSDRTPAVDRWSFESDGEIHYIKFDAADDARGHLIAELTASGLGARHCVRSAWRAKNGRVYAWSIQLALRGSRQECEQRVRAILDPAAMEYGSLPNGRGRRRTGAAATKGPPKSRALTLSVDDEPTANDTIEVNNKLLFEVLPPGSGIHDLAATIRTSGNRKYEELDLRRLRVLADIEGHFPERHPRRYASGFPSDEKDNRYVVLVMTAPSGGEDAIAISPLLGQHATFLVRHSVAQQPWRTVLSKTKAEAVELGADRLIFRARPDEGMDGYEAMRMKIIELLDDAPNPIGGEQPLARSGSYLAHRRPAKDNTYHQQSPPSGADEDSSAATFSERSTLEAMLSQAQSHRVAELAIGCVAETPQQLNDLFHFKPRYWRPAAFASLLVQRVGLNDVMVDDGLQRCVGPANCRVRTVGELAALVDEVCDEVVARARALAQYLVSAPFERLFAPAAEEPAAEAIVAAAKHVFDFYRANLLLAQRVRRTDAPRRYRKVIESAAHLVDRNLEGVDEFITVYAGFVNALPSMERNMLHENVTHIVPINFYPDNQLLDRIVRSLKVLVWVDRLWPR